MTWSYLFLGPYLAMYPSHDAHSLDARDLIRSWSNVILTASRSIISYLVTVWIFHLRSTLIVLPGRTDLDLVTSYPEIKITWSCLA